MRLRLSALLCLLLSLLGTTSLCAQQAFRFPEGKLGTTAELRHVRGVPVLLVSGTPREIGQSVGQLALKPARRMLSYPRDLLHALRVDLLWGFFLTGSKRLYGQFPDDYKAETEAIIEAAGADRDLVIAGNTFFDLTRFFLCSGLGVCADRSNTAGPLLGRNLDYPSLGYGQFYTLVTVYRPKGKLAFASIGFPGLVGVLSGMNEAGLCLGVLEVYDLPLDQKKYDPTGVPYALCLRQLLEEARTIDEAVTLLNKLKRTTTINVLMADRNEVSVLEVSPQRVVRRPSSNGFCASTNHFLSEPLRVEKPANIHNTLERMEKLQKVGASGERLGVEAIRKHLHDVRLEHFTLQTMVFEPRALRLHLSIGKIPASSGPLQPIDLAELLRPVAVGQRDRR